MTKVTARTTIPPHFRFWILDFRLSEENAGSRIKNVLVMFFSSCAQSKIQNRKYKIVSSDHFIRPLEHADWNCQTNLFGRLEVNDELKLRRLLNRQISRFGTFQDLVHVNSRAPIEISGVRPVRHETTLIDKLLVWVTSRQPVFTGKLDDPLSFGKKAVTGRRHNRAHLLLLC